MFNNDLIVISIIFKNYTEKMKFRRILLNNPCFLEDLFLPKGGGLVFSGNELC
jgi:hypothetical protein